MSDTPRTDQVRNRHRGDTEGLCRALIAHSNQLERELNAMTFNHPYDCYWSRRALAAEKKIEELQKL